MALFFLKTLQHAGASDLSPAGCRPPSATYGKISGMTNTAGLVMQIKSDPPIEGELANKTR